MTTFVSYSGDRDRRRKLVCALREHGVTPWRDVEDLDLGDATTESIEAELGRCSTAILWVNDAVLASDYVATIELPAIARAARVRGLRIVPVFDGLSPDDAAERVSRFGIEIGDNNGHIVDTTATDDDTAAAVAARCIRAAVRTAHRDRRAPIVRVVTYDDTADHRDDAVANLDWRHAFEAPTLDPDDAMRLRNALATATAALKATYGPMEITVAAKVHLPVAVALGHAFFEPTGCTIRMERGDATYTTGRNVENRAPLEERPHPKGPIDARVAAVEVAVSREVETGVTAYIAGGQRYRERVEVIPATGAGRFTLDDPRTCNAWGHQIANVLARLNARSDVDRVDVFMACPVELAIAIGWWTNAIGPVELLNWSGKSGPYAPMWQLP